ncbi:MAG: serine/threonine protein kinase [Polyangiaceae bacterium]|nr:serine/threonine protein kinase [Polyangiaceae bacterium]
MVQGAPDSHRVERIGDFQILRVIGEGGMGIVYDATERLSGRRVALKVLHSNLTRREDARARFFNEMRIMAGLEHPNIVRSLSSAEIDGKLVMVLEYLEGRTLRAELEATGPLEPARAIAVAKAITSALVAAHERMPPVVHRDLKPENLMILRDGSVKVMDFGVAKVLADEPGLTQASQAVGTVLYMSPEQAEGRPVTPKTDLYALGLVLYEMLTGKPLFDGPSIVGILRQHCEAAPPPFTDDLRRRLPADLDALVFQLLEKAPDRRPADARTVLRRLEGMNPGAVAPALDPLRSSGPRIAPFVGRAAAKKGGKLDTIELLNRLEKPRKWPWIAGAIGVLVVGAAIAVPWTLYLQSRETTVKRKPTATASAETPPVAPAPAPSATASSCGEALACEPFNPPDPAHVDFELMLTRATQVARRVEPTAQLSDISFLVVSEGATVNLTGKRAVSFFHFDVPAGDLSVAVRATDLVADMTAIKKRPPLPPLTCSFKRAVEAAVAGGFEIREMDFANLGIAPVSKKSQWVIVTDGQSAQVNATTCELFRKKK